MKNQIENMTGPELVATFNTVAKKLGESSVKRFSTRAAGIKRTAAIIAKLEEKEASEGATDKVEKKCTVKSICKGIFEDGGKDLTRQGFIKDCVEAGVSGSTAAALWLPLGGARKFSRK